MSRRALDSFLGAHVQRQLPDAVAELGVSQVTASSDQVTPDSLFMALRGAHSHGLDYLDEAIGNGASCVAFDPDGASDLALKRLEKSGVPVFPVPELTALAGPIAADFYHHPADDLTMVGVTGTNGKTSVTHLLAQAMADGAVLGTLGFGRPQRLYSLTHTTPDAVSLQRVLAALRASGARAVAMEVSSHALAQGRVDALPFHTAVFTNLSRDHLDYHRDMAEYGATKTRLMNWPGLQVAVVNGDDPYVASLEIGPQSRRIVYGFNADAQVRATDLELTGEGASFRFQTPAGSSQVTVPLLARFNVYNVLAAAAVLVGLDWTLNDVTDALNGLQPVAGRMQAVSSNPLVVIDYAHTPAALEQALEGVRGHHPRHLECVFGCGGNRDRGKRGQMGLAAEDGADEITLTDDNPRNEDGNRIIRDILQGMVHPERARICRDRPRAIADSIQRASPEDAVLIAGKGSEAFQWVGDQKRPMSDVALARQALKTRQVSA